MCATSKARSSSVHLLPTWLATGLLHGSTNLRVLPALFERVREIAGAGLVCSMPGSLSIAALMASETADELADFESLFRHNAKKEIFVHPACSSVRRSWRIQNHSTHECCLDVEYET